MGRRPPPWLLSWRLAVSSQWTVYCETCDESGPDLRRQPGCTMLLDRDDWSPFLIEHEYHRLVLRHE